MGKSMNLSVLPLPVNNGFFSLGLAISQRGKKLWISTSFPNLCQQLTLCHTLSLAEGLDKYIRYDKVLPCLLTEMLLYDIPMVLRGCLQGFNQLCRTRFTALCLRRPFEECRRGQIFLLLPCMGFALCEASTTKQPCIIFWHGGCQINTWSY